MVKKVLNIILDIIIVVVIILLVYIMIQKSITKENYTNIFGYTFLEVLTGSMSGTIEIGDGVIVKLTKEVEEEDIIVYEKDNSFITHRLIEKQQDELITKGDANNVQDEPITNDMVIGKVIKIIPNVNLWKKIIIGIVIALIIVFIIVKINFLKKRLKK